MSYNSIEKKTNTNNNNSINNHNNTAYVSILAKTSTILSILLPFIAFVTLLIVRQILIIQSTTSDSLLLASKSNNATELTEAFREATIEQINQYIISLWYNTIIVIIFGIFIAAILYALFNTILMIGGTTTTTIRLILFCTTIPGYITSGWIENTALIMSYISSMEEETMFDERLIRQYTIWNILKWIFLSINILACIIVGVIKILFFTNTNDNEYSSDNSYNNNNNNNNDRKKITFSDLDIIHHIVPDSDDDKQSVVSTGSFYA